MRSAGPSAARYALVTSVVLISALLVGCGGEAPPSELDAAYPPGVDASLDGAGELPGEDAGTACGAITSWSPSSVVVVPGQVVVLDAQAPVDLARTEARFEGGEPLALGAADSRSVGFLAPELAPGPHVLVVQACGGRWEETLTFEVAPDVTDPDAVVEGLLAAMEPELDALALDPAIGPTAVTGPRNLIARARSSYAALAAPERLEVARFVAANSWALGSFVPLCNTDDEGLDRVVPCLRARAGAWLVRLLAGAWITAAGSILSSPFPLAGPVITAIGVAAIAKELQRFRRDIGPALFERGVQALELGLGWPIFSGGGPAPPFAGFELEVGMVAADVPLSVFVVGEYGASGVAVPEGHLAIQEVLGIAARFAETWTAVERVLALLDESLGVAAPTLGTSRELAIAELAFLRISLDAPPGGLVLQQVRDSDGSVELTFRWNGTDSVDAVLLVRYDNPGVRTFEQRFAVTVRPALCGMEREPCCAGEVCMGTTPGGAPLACILGRCGGGRVGDPCAESTECASLRCGRERTCLRASEPGALRCALDSDCASGESCEVDPGTTGADLTCRATVSCVADADCSTSGAGTLCGPEMVCQWGATGDPCTADEDCVAYCVGGRCSASPPVLAGIYCGGDAECAHISLLGTHCLASEVCGGGRWQLCSDASDCRDPAYPACRGGFCAEAVPEFPFSPGATCVTSATCDSGICTAGICRPEPVPLGLGCASDADCQGRSPSNWRYCGPGGFCQLGEAGDACADDGDCHARTAFSRCRGGVCNEGWVGDACSTDAECDRPFGAAPALLPVCVATRCRVGGVGDPCRTDSDCDRQTAYAGAVHCGATGYCQFGVDGDPCTSDAQCAGPCLDDTCRSWGWRTLPWSHVCVDGTCSSGWVGDACLDDLDCPAGGFDGAMMVPGRCGPAGTATTGVCQPGTEGDPCLDDTDCSALHECRFGRCARHAP